MGFGGFFRKSNNRQKGFFMAFFWRLGEMSDRVLVMRVLYEVFKNQTTQHLQKKNFLCFTIGKLL
jgi:hypothetical protein